MNITHTLRFWLIQILFIILCLAALSFTAPWAFDKLLDARPGTPLWILILTAFYGVTPILLALLMGALMLLSQPRRAA